MDFDEVREYEPGDDVRAIDWNASARTGRTFVKKYREERQLTVVFVVDMSASGSLGAGDATKREQAVEIAGVLALAALRSDHRVGLVLFTDAVESFVPPARGRAHAFRLVRDLVAFEPQGTRDEPRRRAADSCASGSAGARSSSFSRTSSSDRGRCRAGTTRAPRSRAATRRRRHPTRRSARSRAPVRGPADARGRRDRARSSRSTRGSARRIERASRGRRKRPTSASARSAAAHAWTCSRSTRCVPTSARSSGSSVREEVGHEPRRHRAFATSVGADPWRIPAPWWHGRSRIALAIWPDPGGIGCSIRRAWSALAATLGRGRSSTPEERARQALARGGGARARRARSRVGGRRRRDTSRRARGAPRTRRRARRRRAELPPAPGCRLPRGRAVDAPRLLELLATCDLTRFAMARLDADSLLASTQAARELVARLFAAAGAVRPPRRAPG